MPSTATITSFYSFVPKTRIESAKVNNNFSVFRGHLIPVDPTATSSPNMTYDLGADTHSWRGVYSQYGIMYQNTAGSVPANPTAGSMAFYFKNDGHLYKKDPSGTEVDMNASAGGGGFTYVGRTSSYTATAQEFVNVTANTCTVTLPTASGIAGQSVIVRNSGTAKVSILFNGAETAEAYTQIDLSNAKEEIKFTSNGTGWMIDAYRFMKSTVLYSAAAGSSLTTRCAGGMVRINTTPTTEGNDLTSSQDNTDGVIITASCKGRLTVQWGVDTSGGNSNELYLNGAPYQNIFGAGGAGSIINSHAGHSITLPVVAGDFVQIFSTGGAVDTLTGAAIIGAVFEKEL